MAAVFASHHRRVGTAEAAAASVVDESKDEDDDEWSGWTRDGNGMDEILRRAGVADIKCRAVDPVKCTHPMRNKPDIRSADGKTKIPGEPYAMCIFCGASLIDDNAQMDAYLAAYAMSCGVCGSLEGLEQRKEDVRWCCKACKSIQPVVGSQYCMTPSCTGELKTVTHEGFGVYCGDCGAQVGDAPQSLEDKFWRPEAVEASKENSGTDNGHEPQQNPLATTLIKRPPVPVVMRRSGYTEISLPAKGSLKKTADGYAATKDAVAALIKIVAGVMRVEGDHVLKHACVIANQFIDDCNMPKKVRVMRHGISRTEVSMSRAIRNNTKCQLATVALLVAADAAGIGICPKDTRKIPAMPEQCRVWTSTLYRKLQIQHTNGESKRTIATFVAHHLPLFQMTKDERASLEDLSTWTTTAMVALQWVTPPASFLSEYKTPPPPVPGSKRRDTFGSDKLSIDWVTELTAVAYGNDFTSTQWCGMMHPNTKASIETNYASGETFDCTKVGLHNHQGRSIGAALIYLICKRRAPPRKERKARAVIAKRRRIDDDDDESPPPSSSQLKQSRVAKTAGDVSVVVLKDVVRTLRRVWYILMEGDWSYCLKE